MSNTLRSAVISRPEFKKVAGVVLSNNVADWNEEIINKFYEDVPYIPRGFSVEPVIKSVDENNGYAKGSVVVRNGDKKVNFPVIVKNYELCPFDVFVIPGDVIKYIPASFESLRSAMSNVNYGSIDKNDKGSYDSGIKPVGGIYPKQSVSADDIGDNTSAAPLSKMSGMCRFASKPDIEKLAETINSNPGIRDNFVDNTGDMVFSMIDAGMDSRVVVDKQKQGVLDIGDVIKAKRALTVIDSNFFDVNTLVPIQAPSVCEIRTYSYPTMEDFIESGRGAADRVLASQNGNPVSGVVLDMVESSYIGNSPVEVHVPTSSQDEANKNGREHRKQIFISLCGNYYNMFDDYDKTGIGYYGMNIVEADGALSGAISIIASNTTDETIRTFGSNESNADKKFSSCRCGENAICGPDSLVVIYGAGNAYECISFSGSFVRKHINGSYVYVGSGEAIIPCNVASVQKVRGVRDPIYKMAIGNAKSVFLVPESSVVINTKLMKNIQRGDMMSPNVSIRNLYEKAEIQKVSFCVGDGGYKIDGEPVAGIKKLAGIGDRCLSTKEAKVVLSTIGVHPDKHNEIMKTAILRCANDNVNDKNVYIYGVRSDYVNENAMSGIEKSARVRSILSDIARELKRDLVKEASAISDPEAVDVVLSLNFINEGNLAEYVESIPEMSSVLSSLCELLVASRMGLKEIDEGATKRAISGLSEVIDGLKNIKMAVGDIK